MAALQDLLDDDLRQTMGSGAGEIELVTTQDRQEFKIPFDGLNLRMLVHTMPSMFSHFMHGTTQISTNPHHFYKPTIVLSTRLAARAFLKYAFTKRYSTDDVDMDNNVLLHAEMYFIGKTHHIKLLRKEACRNLYTHLVTVPTQNPLPPYCLVEAIKFAYYRGREDGVQIEPLKKWLISYCVTNFTKHGLATHCDLVSFMRHSRTFTRDLCRENLYRDFRDTGAAAIIQTPNPPTDTEEHDDAAWATSILTGRMGELAIDDLDSGDYGFITKSDTEDLFREFETDGFTFIVNIKEEDSAYDDNAGLVREVLRDVEQERREKKALGANLSSDPSHDVDSDDEEWLREKIAADTVAHAELDRFAQGSYADVSDRQIHRTEVPVSPSALWFGTRPKDTPSTLPQNTFGTLPQNTFADRPRTPIGHRPSQFSPARMPYREEASLYHSVATLKDWNERPWDNCNVLPHRQGPPERLAGLHQGVGGVTQNAEGGDDDLVDIDVAEFFDPASSQYAAGSSRNGGHARVDSNTTLRDFDMGNTAIDGLSVGQTTLVGGKSVKANDAKKEEEDSDWELFDMDEKRGTL